MRTLRPVERASFPLCRPSFEVKKILTSDCEIIGSTLGEMGVAVEPTFVYNSFTTKAGMKGARLSSTRAWTLSFSSYYYSGHRDAGKEREEFAAR